MSLFSIPTFLNHANIYTYITDNVGYIPATKSATCEQNATDARKKPGVTYMAVFFKGFL